MPRPARCSGPSQPSTLAAEEPRGFPPRKPVLHNHSSRLTAARQQERATVKPPPLDALLAFAGYTFAFAAICGGNSGTAQADGCNIANVLYGKVRMEIIPHTDYETGIVFGDDFDSKRFSDGKILGQIAGAERDGSHRVSDVNGEVCGIIESNLSIDTSEANCGSCAKTQIFLRKVPPNSYVVMSGGTIVGTISGRLNR
jgi:hypothetical protein